MRQLYLLVFLCSFLPCSAQIMGKRIDGPVSYGDFDLKPGDTLYLGRGSANGGLFSYIEQPANFLTSSRARSLDSRYAGKYVVIKYFKNQKDAHSGEKVFAIVNPYGGLNFSVDVLSAIDTGEVVAINGRSVGTKLGKDKPAVSTADELLKLKQLLDAGALTQEEYNAQKKKLLN